MKTLTLILMLPLVLEAEPRAWKSSDGRELAAEFVRLDGEGVRVKRLDGGEVTIPKAMLAQGEWEAAEKLAADAASKMPVEVKAEPTNLTEEEQEAWKKAHRDHQSVADVALEVQLSSLARTDRELVVEVIWFGSDKKETVEIDRLTSLARQEVVLPPDGGTYRVPMAKHVERWRLDPKANIIGNSKIWAVRVLDPATGAVLGTASENELAAEMLAKLPTFKPGDLD